MSVQNGIVAGIVAFRPAPEHLLGLARAASAETEHVIVFANGVLAAPLAAALRQAGAELIEAECNLGVAEALNVIAQAARLRDARRVMLLDEDATWAAGALAQLSDMLDALQAAGESAAVIGPRIVAPSSAYIAPRYFSAGDKAHEGARAVRYIITSGSLVCLEAFRNIGPFRSDFFIDMVDVEWCFRARSKGYSCWCADDLTVEHSVGQGEVRALGMRAAWVDKNPNAAKAILISDEALSGAGALDTPVLPGSMASGTPASRGGWPGRASSRIAWAGTATRLDGGGASSAHVGRLDWDASDALRIGALLAFGRELENIPGRGVVSSSVRGAALKANYAWTPSWAISAEATAHRQGDLYERNGLRIGVRYQH